MDWKSLKDNLPKKAKDELTVPPARSLGTGLANLIDVFMFPINMAGTYAHGELEKYKKEIQQEVEKVPLDNRDTSKWNLVLKALEMSKFQLDDADLRKAFANLIAATIDNRTNTNITPRFATVLSNLDGQDARLLKEIDQSRKCEIYNVSGYVEFDKPVYISTPILYLGSEYDVLTDKEFSINALESLGILKESEIDITIDNISKEAYLLIVAKINRQMNTKLPLDLDGRIQILNRKLTITEFGKKFMSCVVRDVNERIEE